MRKPCIVEGCEQLRDAKGLCPKHYYQANRAAYKARQERYLARPEIAEKRKSGARAYREKDPDRHRQYYRQSVGFWPGLVEKLRVVQGGCCSICKVVLVLARKDGPRFECADHDHSTVEARGLLCDPCNKALGLYEKYQRCENFKIQSYEDYLNNPPVRKCYGI